MFGTNKVIKQLEERLKMQSQLYEARISDLMARISDLREVAIPKNTAYSIPLVQQEADAIMSGKDEVIELTESQLAEQDAEISERDRLLSGTY